MILLGIIQYHCRQFKGTFDKDTSGKILKEDLKGAEIVEESIKTWWNNKEAFYIAYKVVGVL